MADENEIKNDDCSEDFNNLKRRKGDGAAVVYVETVNGYAGPNVILTANDVKAYTTAQSDAKFTVPIASATTLGKVRVGAGLTIDANGILGTTSAAPDWNAIVNKPTEFPPNKAGLTTVGGVKVGTGLSIATDGTLSATATAPDWSQITGKPAAYPPTTASATQIGGVKQGAGIFIDPQTGTINATGSSPTWDSILDKPVVFPPPIASHDVLGGVKEGLNVEIQTDGTISAFAKWDDILGKPAEFPPIPASKTVRGGIFVGEGLQDDGNGVVSVKLATRTDIGGVIPGDTLTTDAISGRLDVVPASKENVGCVKIGDTLYIDDNGYLEANPGAISPATADTLGGVKIGAGLNVTEEGVLSQKLFPFAKNQFVVRNAGMGKDGTADWTVPEGCEIFQVTVIGAGGCGGSAGSAKTGGGGGGGGGWLQATFVGVPAGTVFTGVAATGGYFENYPDPAHSSKFIDKKSGKELIVATGGGTGQKGNTTDANAIALGGKGGYPTAATYDGMKYTISGNGATGGWGMCLNGKKIGGLGGGSMYGGGNWYCDAGGSGGGAGGDNFGGDNAAGGAGGLVIINW